MCINWSVWITGSVAVKETLYSELFSAEMSMADVGVDM